MSRFKRLWKRLAIGLALFAAVLLLAVAILHGWAGHRLEQKLAVLRAAGEPTCLAELAPRPIPPEQNAAFLLQRAAPELEAFAKEHSDFFKMPLGQSYDERQPPTPEQVEFMRAVLDLHPELLRTLQQAAACEGYASQLDFSLNDPNQFFEKNNKSLQNFRSVGRFLRWRNIVLVAEGEQEQAAETGLVLLRLTRLYGAEPLLVNSLVAIAMRGIAIEGLNHALRAGPISAELHQKLDQELARQDDPQWIVRVMKTERAYSLSAAGQLVVVAYWIPWSGKWLQADMIDYYDKLIPVMAQPWYQSHTKIHGLNHVSHWSPFSSTMISLLMPAIDAYLEAINRDTAMVRSLRVVGALTAYAQANGHEARGLDDLHLPAAATLDPFSGQPLKLRSTDDGWVVYSVFKNGADDGGDFHEMADWGLGPVGYRQEE